MSVIKKLVRIILNSSQNNTCFRDINADNTETAC